MQLSPAGPDAPAAGPSHRSISCALSHEDRFRQLLRGYQRTTCRMTSSGNGGAVRVSRQVAKSLDGLVACDPRVVSLQASQRSYDLRTRGLIRLTLGWQPSDLTGVAPPPTLGDTIERSSGLRWGVMGDCRNAVRRRKSWPPSHRSSRFDSLLRANQPQFKPTL